jgi:hypothetical protein
MCINMSELALSENFVSKIVEDMNAVRPTLVPCTRVLSQELVVAQLV